MIEITFSKIDDYIYFCKTGAHKGTIIVAVEKLCEKKRVDGVFIFRDKPIGMYTGGKFVWDV